VVEVAHHRDFQSGKVGVAGIEGNLESRDLKPLLFNPAAITEAGGGDALEGGAKKPFATGKIHGGRFGSFSEMAMKSGCVFREKMGRVGR
jgi:hypothetical protein